MARPVDSRPRSAAYRLQRFPPPHPQGSKLKRKRAPPPLHGRERQIPLRAASRPHGGRHDGGMPESTHLFGDPPGSVLLRCRMAAACLRATTGGQAWPLGFHNTSQSPCLGLGSGMQLLACHEQPPCPHCTDEDGEISPRSSRLGRKAG